MNVLYAYFSYYFLNMDVIYETNGYWNGSILYFALFYRYGSLVE